MTEMFASANLENWKTQVKKGYLELCILLLIFAHERLYGLDLLERLRQLDLPLKEGTLYPMLNRLTSEGWLKASWQEINLKGPPRKFYALTKKGARALHEMDCEFTKMIEIVTKLKRGTRQ